MKQYNQFQVKFPDALLLFRFGDFYESFGDIMKRYSETPKPSNSPQAVPMGEIRENLRQEVFKLVLSER